MKIFIGRENEIDLLRKRIAAFLEGYRQNIAIIGKTLVGKTSLLQRVTRESLPNTLTLFINTEHTTYRAFIKKTCFALLHSFLASKNIQQADIFDLDHALAEAEKSIPQTTEMLKNAINQKENIEMLTAALDTFLKENPCKLIIVIENFVALQSYSKKIFTQLAKYILTQKDIMYIITSSQTREALKALSTDLNLLFGNFEIIHLTNLSYKDSETLLTLNAEAMPELFTKFLVDITDGHPYYLSCVANTLRNLQIKDWSNDIFIKVLAEIFSNEYSILYQLFNTRIQLIQNAFRADDDIISTLLVIVSGYKRMREIAFMLKIDTNTARVRLAKLAEEDIIGKSGALYHVTDTLFAVWLDCVLRQQIEFPHSEEQMQKNIQQAILEKISVFKETCARSKLDRIVELIHLFKDDTINLGKKNIILPQIQKYKVIPSGNENMSFIIGEGRQYLIVALKNGPASENDITEFANRCSYFRNKQLKKILISTNNTTDSSRLLAKEKKLLLWEEHEINALLRLYNKSILL